MNDFLITALSFPTLLWSVMLSLCAAYWLMAASGLVDATHVHLDTGHVDGGHGHLHPGHLDADHQSFAGMVAGLADRLGLGGVPVMLSVTLLSLYSWIICYMAALLLLPMLDGRWQVVGGMITLVAATMPAVLASALSLIWLRPALGWLSPPEAPSLIGRAARVITPGVDARSGMAELADGGAGLRLQVRSPLKEHFVRGDAVVLLEYDPADNSYVVIPAPDV
ncbi:hypothetical protein [Deinococcus humi]|uniref:Phage shock protein PspC (Stress-responsive transcriptional regulator) n=1 Tax=Deinococcus humi TaxID=662880 RepID=A0A7W8JRD7_9DEIO|nr:hypothetical protein [Deinococcus humi]MBB5361791.1 phage shock protein PspC (stress-responsive transcriptional regulator) [Deinococcus humi]GGO23670.1 hypothetical protein GCM10008949_12040 [Deinococcus humi]